VKTKFSGNWTSQGRDRRYQFTLFYRQNRIPQFLQCFNKHPEPPGEKCGLVLSGEKRFRIIDWVSKTAPHYAQVKYFPEVGETDTLEIKAYVTAVINTIKERLPLNPLYGEELKIFAQNFRPNDPFRLAVFGASLTTAEAGELQQVLETVNINSRLEKTLVLLQKELGINKHDRTAELRKFRQRIEKIDVPANARTRIDEELQKLSVLELGSAEYTVTRNYLEWLTSSNALRSSSVLACSSAKWRVPFCC
jgi:ATP-dependent Lon protease